MESRESFGSDLESFVNERVGDCSYNYNSALIERLPLMQILLNEIGIRLRSGHFCISFVEMWFERFYC